MKKRYGFLLLCLTGCMLAGCQKGETPAESALPQENSQGNMAQEQVPEVLADVQYITEFESMNDGILLDSANGLQFRDVENDLETFVCPVAGCDHTDEKICAAMQLSCMKFPVLYEGKIYGIYESALRGTVVYSCNLDGSDRKVCYTFEKPVGIGFNAVRVGKKLYYLANYNVQEVDEDGHAWVSHSEAALYSTDLTSGATQTVYAFPDCRESSLGKIRFTGTKLLVYASLQQKTLRDIGYTNEEYMEGVMGENAAAFTAEIEAKLEKEMQWILVDPTDGTASKLELPEAVQSGVAYEGAWDDALLYGKGQEATVYKMPFDTLEEEVFLESQGENSIYITELTNGVLVRRIWAEDGSRSTYEFYEHLSQEPHPVALREGMLFQIWNESENKCYVSWMPGDRNSDASECDYEVLDKGAFLLGEKK